MFLVCILALLNMLGTAMAQSLTYDIRALSTAKYQFYTFPNGSSLYQGLPMWWNAQENPLSAVYSPVSSGKIITVDQSDGTVFSINIADGVRTVIAGSSGSNSTSVEGSFPNSRLALPMSIIYDPPMNCFLVGTTSRIYKIESAFPYNVTTFAYAGGFDIALSVEALQVPRAAGARLFTTNYHQVMAATMTATGMGTLTSYAGNGVPFGYQDGVGTAAQFHQPRRLAVNNCSSCALRGYIFVADSLNGMIRQVHPTNATVTTYACVGRGWFDGKTTCARCNPTAIAITNSGVVLFGDALSQADGLLLRVVLNGYVFTMQPSRAIDAGREIFAMHMSFFPNSETELVVSHTDGSGTISIVTLPPMNFASINATRSYSPNICLGFSCGDCFLPPKQHLVPFAIQRGAVGLGPNSQNADLLSPCFAPYYGQSSGQYGGLSSTGDGAPWIYRFSRDGNNPWYNGMTQNAGALEANRTGWTKCHIYQNGTKLVELFASPQSGGSVPIRGEIYTFHPQTAAVVNRTALNFPSGYSTPVSVPLSTEWTSWATFRYRASEGVLDAFWYANEEITPAKGDVWVYAQFDESSGNALSNTTYVGPVPAKIFPYMPGEDDYATAMTVNRSRHIFVMDENAQRYLWHWRLNGVYPTAIMKKQPCGPVGGMAFDPVSGTLYMPQVIGARSQPRQDGAFIIETFDVATSAKGQYSFQYFQSIYATPYLRDVNGPECSGAALLIDPVEPQYLYAAVLRGVNKLYVFDVSGQANGSITLLGYDDIVIPSTMLSALYTGLGFGGPLNHICPHSLMMDRTQNMLHLTMFDRFSPRHWGVALIELVKPFSTTNAVQWLVATQPCMSTAGDGCVSGCPNPNPGQVGSGTTEVPITTTHIRTFFDDEDEVKNTSSTDPVTIILPVVAVCGGIIGSPVAPVLQYSATVVQLLTVCDGDGQKLFQDLHHVVLPGYDVFGSSTTAQFGWAMMLCFLPVLLHTIAFSLYGLKLPEAGNGSAEGGPRQDVENTDYSGSHPDDQINLLPRFQRSAVKLLYPSLSLKVGFFLLQGILQASIALLADNPNAGRIVLAVFGFLISAVILILAFRINFSLKETYVEEKVFSGYTSLPSCCTLCILPDHQWNDHAPVVATFGEAFSTFKYIHVPAASVVFWFQVVVISVIVSIARIHPGFCIPAKYIVATTLCLFAMYIGGFRPYRLPTNSQFVILGTLLTFAIDFLLIVQDSEVNQRKNVTDLCGTLYRVIFGLAILYGVIECCIWVFEKLKSKKEETSDEEPKSGEATVQSPVFGHSEN